MGAWVMGISECIPPVRLEWLSIPSEITFDLAGGGSGKAHSRAPGWRSIKWCYIKEKNDSYSLFPVNLKPWNCSVFQAISQVAFIWYGLEILYETLTWYEYNWTPWQDVHVSDLSYNQPTGKHGFVQIGQILNRSRVSMTSSTFECRCTNTAANRFRVICQGILCCLSYQVDLNMIIPKTNVSFSLQNPFEPHCLLTTNIGSSMSLVGWIAVYTD